jgi:hypothetical protein
MALLYADQFHAQLFGPPDIHVEVPAFLDIGLQVVSRLLKQGFRIIVLPEFLGETYGIGVVLFAVIAEAPGADTSLVQQEYGLP